MRPFVKPTYSLVSTNDKFPAPAFEQISNHHNCASPTGYTPSGLERKNTKETISKPEQSSPRLLDIDLTTSEALFKDDFPSESAVNHNKPPAPRPILSSNSSPARHRNSEELSEASEL